MRRAQLLSRDWLQLVEGLQTHLKSAGKHVKGVEAQFSVSLKLVKTP